MLMEKYAAPVFIIRNAKFINVCRKNIFRVKYARNSSFAKRKGGDKSYLNVICFLPTRVFYTPTPLLPFSVRMSVSFHFLIYLGSGSLFLFFLHLIPTLTFTVKVENFEYKILFYGYLIQTYVGRIR